MDDYEGKLSNCCGAPIVWGDVCQACLEHCTPEENEEGEE